MDRDQDRFFREIFEAHGHHVFRRARAMLGNDADAEEATQEVFVRVMQRYETFHEESGLSTWLYRMTTNYCLNHIRDRKRQAELLEAHSERVAPRDSTVDSDDVVLLRGLLSDADQAQARAAVYVYMDGMSLQEAAEQLDVSKRSVTNLLNRFREWARKRSSR